MKNHRIKHASIHCHDSKLVISGDLCFSTVTKVWRASLSLLVKQPHWLFDFSQVKSCNSAALALVLEWLKYAKRENKTIQLLHLPQQLLSIAKVAGVEQILNGHVDISLIKD